MTSINQKGRYGRYLHHILTATDFILINLAFLVTACCTTTFAADRGRTVWLLANIAYIPIAIWLSPTHKQRSIHLDHVIATTLKALTIHALLFISTLYFVGIDSIKWKAFALFYGILFISFPLWRTISRWIIKSYRSHGRNFSKVVIVGTNLTGHRLSEMFQSDIGFGYKFMGFFDDNPDGNIDPELYRGTISDLAYFVREEGIDEIFYTLSGEDEAALQQAISIADDNVAHFYYVPQLNRYLNRGFELTALGTMPVLSVRRNPLSSLTNRALKRCFDITASSLALLLSPLVLIPVSIAIKLSSPGPVFFRQKRTGYRGREFECIKFRTMKVNNIADITQATKDDPRKTRLGNFLRHTSIDELPQFWNVLRGDMSIVGPRPHMLRHTEEYSRLIGKYMVRHMVKPGITGWAQVNGYRGETKKLWQMEKRVEYDVWYIEHWTLLLDIKIMFRTVFNAIRGEKNAF